MSDPITILGTVVGGLVSVFGVYMQYKSAVQSGKSVEKDTKVDQGKQVAEVLETAIITHGSEDERADLANFARNPTRYVDSMIQVINALAQRDPALAARLVALAQMGTQQPQTGVAIQNNESNYGAQGIFNAPVNIGTLPRDDKNERGA